MILAPFLLLLITCSALPAASAKPMLPYEGKRTGVYAEHEKFLQALRNNDADYVDRHLPAQLHHKFGGNISIFHIAVAMEHFHGHNPKDIIDIFAEKTKHHGSGNSWGIRYLCDLEANVNHPDFIYMCTGKQRKGHTAIEVPMTPLELALRYESIKTLCAISDHCNINHQLMPFYRDPRFEDDIDLAERSIKNTRWRSIEGDYYLDREGAEPIITHFGMRGIHLMRKYNIQLFGTHPRYTLTTVYDIFAKHYPDQIDTINAFRPAPEVGLFARIGNWLQGSSSTQDLADDDDIDEYAL